MKSSPALEPTPASVREARRFIVGALPDDVPVDTSEIVVLLVSELASNAVSHAATPFRVFLADASSRLRVVVEDGSPDKPRVRHARPTDLTGRGLALIESLATRWGVDSERDGKRVWFELDY